MVFGLLQKMSHLHHSAETSTSVAGIDHLVNIAVLSTTRSSKSQCLALLDSSTAHFRDLIIDNRTLCSQIRLHYSKPFLENIVGHSSSILS